MLRACPVCGYWFKHSDVHLEHSKVKMIMPMQARSKQFEVGQV